MKLILIIYVRKLLLLLLCIKLNTADFSSDNDLIIKLKESEKTEKVYALADKFSQMAYQIGFIFGPYIPFDHGRKDINNAVIFLEASTYCNFYEEIQNSNLLCIDCLNISKYFYNDMQVNVSFQYPFNKSVVILYKEEILNYTRLYNAVSATDFEVTDNVFVCLPNNLNRNNINYIKNHWRRESGYIPLTFHQDCENLEIPSSVVAIVTPSPFQLTTEVPTIIYNNPYFINTADLPNAVNLMTDWKPLKYAIVEFMRSLRWNRVAVVTDNDLDSQDFLDDLLPFFDQNQITYTSQICKKNNRNNCDFLDTLLYLKNADARIVILNVNRTNAAKLKFFIDQYASSVKWIVRDWPFGSNEEFQPQRDLFSFTLSPMYDNVHQNVPYISGLVNSINIIGNQYKKAYGDIELFSKNIARAFKNLQISRPYVHIVRKHGNQDFEVVSTMLYNGNGVKEIQRSKIYEIIPEDTSPTCIIIKSRNYSKPCDDEVFIIYLGILVMFVLIFLIILIYFDKMSSKEYRRFF